MSNETKFELESVRRQKSSEVDAMMRLHGLSFTDACRMVALNPARYIRGEQLIEWLPSPDQINKFSKAMRDGEIVVSSRARRLNVERLNVERLLADQPAEDVPEDDWELSDMLPENECVMPPWFNA